MHGGEGLSALPAFRVRLITHLSVESLPLGLPAFHRPEAGKRGGAEDHGPVGAASDGDRVSIVTDPEADSNDLGTVVSTTREPDAFAPSRGPALGALQSRPPPDGLLKMGMGEGREHEGVSSQWLNPVRSRGRDPRSSPDVRCAVALRGERRGLRSRPCGRGGKASGSFPDHTLRLPRRRARCDLHPIPTIAPKSSSQTTGISREDDRRTRG